MIHNTYSETLRYPNLKCTLRVPLIFLTVKKIECENLYFILLLLLHFFLSFSSFILEPPTEDIIKLVTLILKRTTGDKYMYMYGPLICECIHG